MASTMNDGIKSEPLELQPLIITDEIQIKEEQIEDANFDEENKIKNEPEEYFEITFDIKAFACDKCPQVFDKELKLIHHKKAHQKGFSCVKCKKIFKIKNNFDTHSCSFQCLTCGKEFLRRDNLTQHENYVHGSWSENELFSCDHCWKGFKYRKSLVGHMKQHMQVKPLTCGICGKGFSVNNTFKQHLLTHANKFPCDKCPQVFDKKLKLIHHKNAHQKGFSCVKCKKIFKIKNNFDTHSCSFQCLTCGKEFLRRDNLTQHENYVHGSWSENELFSCDHCWKGFKYRKSLVCHMKQHMQVKPLTCGICGKGFSLNNTFKQHLLTHAKKLPCKICGKMLKHSALYYHTKQVHETLKVYDCNSCAASFESKKELTSHMLIHDNRFVCGICDKKFGKLFKLRQHIFLHENPNAFLCQVCNKNFSRKDILESHLRKIHGKNQFKCSLCNFKTMKTCELNDHLEKIHGNFKESDNVVEERKKDREDSYIPCSKCTQAFLGEKSLKIHQMKSHSKSTNCELCESEFKSKRDMLKHLKSVHKI